MQAVIWTKYGPPDVLQLEEIDTPTPKPNELLIQIRATTVAAGDCQLRNFDGLSAFWLPMRLRVGILRPTRVRILGQELSGVVEATGKDVTLFREGDGVFAYAGFRLGAYAEYICLPEDQMVALKPTNVSYEEAAAVPLGGLEACQYLRSADIQPGQRVLINGAGGSIGTFAVQLAKRWGAEVTGVDSGDKLDMLRSIGADHVVDYTREDYTLTGMTYDLIFDAVGKGSRRDAERALTGRGRYLSANPGLFRQIRGAFQLMARHKQVVAEYTRQRNENLLFLRDLIERGEIRSIIDRRYSLREIVEAHRYVETGRKKGIVVITVGPGTNR